MDLILLVLIVLVVLSLGGWGYGYYGARPVRADLGMPAAGPAGWVNPIGIVGALLLIALLVYAFSGWRPVY